MSLKDYEFPKLGKTNSEWGSTLPEEGIQNARWALPIAVGLVIMFNERRDISL